MPTYITQDSTGKITSSADWQFPDSVATDKDVVRGYDGLLYFQGEEPQKPAAQVEAEQLAAFTAAIQTALDDFAKTKNYDGIMSACSYATSTDATFAAEAAYCVTLRDETWRKSYEIMAEVKSGTRAMPTTAELLALLPVSSAAWPTTEA